MWDAVPVKRRYHRDEGASRWAAISWSFTSGSDMAEARASAHGGDDFNSSDTGEIGVMHRGRVEQGDHPGGALLLHIAGGFKVKAT
jgi:hypothetical protein